MSLEFSDGFAVVFSSTTIKRFEKGDLSTMIQQYPQL